MKSSILLILACITFITSCSENKKSQPEKKEASTQKQVDTLQQEKEIDNLVTLANALITLHEKLPSKEALDNQVARARMGVEMNSRLSRGFNVQPTVRLVDAAGDNAEQIGDETEVVKSKIISANITFDRCKSIKDSLVTLADYNLKAAKNCARWANGTSLSLQQLGRQGRYEGTYFYRADEMGKLYSNNMVAFHTALKRLEVLTGQNFTGVKKRLK